MQPITAPKTIETLMQRVNALAGQRFEALAEAIDWPVPNNLRHAKGWVGELLEYHLGTTAANTSAPDFTHLGIELKTLPLDARGLPKESTFVSTLALQSLSQCTWESSRVYKKMQHVLWIPIEAAPTISLPQRRVGQGFLWRPSSAQAESLRTDWEELTEMICLGQIEQISSRMGDCLQIRPKGANNQALVKAVGPDGAPMMTLPRGFYLRPSFTREILSMSREHSYNR